MKSTGNEVTDLFKGCKFGSSISDRLNLFFYILSGLTIFTVLFVVFGKEKTSKKILSKPNLINWFPTKKVNVNINGNLLSLPLVLDNLMFLKSNWESEEQEFMKKIVKTSGIILDIGSNIGYHTILLANENLDSRIISVEASPSIFKTLEDNCNKNKLTNVILYNNAVTDQNDTEINFYNRDSMSTTNKQILDDWQVPENSIKKEKSKTITIDTILEREKVNEVLLLKMDIEGGEILAFEGAKSSLEQKRIQNMMIEYHSGYNRNYLEKELEELDYKISVHERSVLYKNKDYTNGHIFATLKKV